MKGFIRVPVIGSTKPTLLSNLCLSTFAFIGLHEKQLVTTTLFAFDGSEPQYLGCKAIEFAFLTSMITVHHRGWMR